MTLPGIRDAINRISDADLRRAILLCLDARRRKQRIFFIGNGGSAAIASHMAADWLKNGHMAAQCFTDGALVTCLANDLGYGQVYTKPLQHFGKSNDVLFAISSSGKSQNILEACGVAKLQDMKVITLSGFSPDNPLRQQGDVNFYVDSNWYGVVEVTHHAICHAILDGVMNDTGNE